MQGVCPVEDSRTMKNFLLAAILQLSALSAAVQECLDGPFAGANFGLSLMYEDGTEILSVNSGRKLNPASTLKAVTTGAALMSLGRDYTWETVLSYKGSLDGQGILHGDLYIIGGGDPMLGSNDADAQPLEQLYSNWYGMLSAKGITGIDGDIVGDGSWIEGMREEPSWCYEDIGTYYGTCASGLNFFENMVQLKVSANGLAQGARPSIEPVFPDTPWMKWIWDCSVGPAGSGDKLYLYTSELCESAVMRGTYAAGKEGSVFCRNNFPERSLALDFKKYLDGRGFNVKGEAVGIQDRRDVRSAPSVAGKLTYVGSTSSLPLSTVITRTNKDSNNLYAELLLRTLGAEKGGSTMLQQSLQAMQGVLSSTCGCSVEPSSLIMTDGSGLSRKNLVSPAWMSRFLLGMKRSCPDFDVYLGSLVKYSSRCFFKTGSFSGTRCLCGYILPASPEGKAVIFTIMVNDSELKISEIDRIEKKLLNNIAAL